MRLLALLLAVLMLFSACTGSTKYGECIGLNGEEDPKLKYRYSIWNIFLGILFVETIIVPLFVAADYLKCPYATKEVKQ